jgi:hypothetical protein
MRKRLVQTAVSAAFVAGMVAMAAPAHAGSATVTIPGLGTGCDRHVTVGWNIPPGPGQHPVYTYGEVTCD